jgi:hypothetical protein
MPLSERINSAASAFPDQPPGAVAGCPLAARTEEPPAPAEFENTSRITEKILKTMTGAAAEQKSKEKKSWIEIILVDAEGKPVPGVKYRITPPNGSAVEGRLNEHGQAGLYQIEPGNCKITFPDLDKDAWE